MKLQIHGLRWLAVAALLHLAAGRGLAGTYYVATNGNDANSGLTTTSAWRTITHAINIVTSSQHHTISLGAGEYKEWLNITSSLTLVGADVFSNNAPRFARHVTRTLIRPPFSSINSPLIQISKTNVFLKNLTVCGDFDTNGTPDCKVGILSYSRPTTIQYCTISNIYGYGIFFDGTNTPASTGDTDEVRCYVQDNRVDNITASNVTVAVGILLNHAPGSFSGNDVINVTGATCKAGIFVESCFFNLAMTNRLSVSDNAVTNCPLGIWLNKHAEPSEKVDVFRNFVSNAVVGIRITAAKGQAFVSNNVVAVGGRSQNPTNPIYARAIWIHADERPWDTIGQFATDHQVIGNVVSAIPAGRTNSRGFLFEYHTLTSTNQNNGVRARLYANTVKGFDHGVWIESGSYQVSVTNDPLVEVVSRMNVLVGNATNGMYVTNLTASADAISNWWGVVSGPPANSNRAGAGVSYTPWLGYQPADSDSDLLLDLLDEDDDNDAALDWEEIVAGTNPSNSASVFYCDTSLNTNLTLNIQWSSATGRTYRLYRRTIVSTSVWQLVTTQAATPPTNTYVFPLDTNTWHMFKATITN